MVEYLLTYLVVLGVIFLIGLLLAAFPLLFSGQLQVLYMLAVVFLKV